MNLELVQLFSINSWRHVLLIARAQVGTLIEEKFNHVILIAQYCVVDGPLFLHVSKVKIGAKVDQLLGAKHETLTNRVVNGRLSILVLSVEVLTLHCQKRDDVCVALPS